MVHLMMHLIVNLMVALIIDLMVVNLKVALISGAAVNLTVSEISVLLSISNLEFKMALKKNKIWPINITSSTQIPVCTLLISVMFRSIG